VSWAIIITALVLIVLVVIFVLTRPTATVSVLPPDQEYQPVMLADAVVKSKCTRCSGGVQALTGRAWGPVPRSMLMLERTHDGDDIHRPPHANIRPCTSCAGRGFYLTHPELDSVINADGSTS
jgi:hypothetical protein